MAGDFNTHSAEWGSSSEDVRGEICQALLRHRNLWHATLAPHRRVNAESVVDVTFARSPPSNRLHVSNWSVLRDYYSASDHEYVEFAIAAPAVCSVARDATLGSRIDGWASRKLSNETLRAHWDRVGSLVTLPTNAAEQVDFLHGIFSDACDAAMPRRIAFPGRKKMHWWNDNIAALRKSTIFARRCYQSAGRRSNLLGREESVLEYNRLRKELRLSIRKAQEASWKGLCDLVDKDP